MSEHSVVNQHPGPRMDDDLVQILEGNIFVVSDSRGDIEGTPADPTGLFAFDTRFLSRWILTVNGQRLSALSIDDMQYFQARFFLVPGAAAAYTDITLSVIREREVCNGFHEELRILNHQSVPVDLTIRIEADSDFADLFEVREPGSKPGTYHREVEGNNLVLSYRRETYARETWISASTPATVSPDGLHFAITIPAHGEWSTDLDVVASQGAPEGRRQAPVGIQGQGYRRTCQRGMNRGLDKWLGDAPSVHCDWPPMERIYQRCLTDLAALRFETLTLPGRPLPAAGLPWFMTMFGRDSILTSLQALPFTSELASTTLVTLGERQGARTDDFRDEEPGKILHEIRYGELTAFEERPHSPYFGTADATPLYVILLDEYERWTGDTELVRRLEPVARAALTWIDKYGDLQGNGYISYQTRSPGTGLENQGWKDSWDAISYRNGDLPGFPRATCELQGYAYDAKTRAARLARQVWHDERLAQRLETEAADLKDRFNRDFWIADGEYYAVALDSDGRKVDSLTSNIGHLLWSGIVDKARARAVAEHLLGPQLFSGWGVRTLAEGEARYNPIGYHAGTVWPFDNSLIAWGLRRYGFKVEAARIVAGIMRAAEIFDGRLPEAFGGYNRTTTKYPVRYPTACSPQAWSTGAPLLLLRAGLGLEPDGDSLAVDPALPDWIGRLEILDLPGRWQRIDAFGRGRIDTSQKKSTAAPVPTADA